MPRSGIMLCYPFEEKRLLKWHTPVVVVQPKLDGERCRALISNGNVQLLSSECNEILSVPHITDQLSWMFPDGNLELDGELYKHDIDFSEIHSRVGRTVNLHEDASLLEYHVFDIVSPGDQLQRLQFLFSLFENKHFPNVHLVPNTVTQPAVSSIMSVMEAYVSKGYEGIIVRSPDCMYVRKRSTQIMKFKPKKKDYYQIVGFQEEISIDGTPKGTLGAFICVGTDGTKFGVGTGFTAQQRAEYWEKKESLVGSYVEVNYQTITPKHVPRFPVYCRILDFNPERVD